MISVSNYDNFILESFLDYPDNSSLAIVFYIPGCNNNCIDCHNKELQQYQNFEDEDLLIDFLEKVCRKSNTNKLCLQGGDPLYKHNLLLTQKILKNLGNKIDICIYTGFDISYIKKLNLANFKFIKCGKFNKDLFIGSVKTDTYLQLASKNQQLYNHKFELLSKDGIYYF